jgi:hypothetical protein
MFAAYFLESGILLIVLPWSRLWDDNRFLTLVPSLGALLTSSFVRGAVTGIGVLTAIAGMVELAVAVVRRRGVGVSSSPHNV